MGRDEFLALFADAALAQQEELSVMLKGRDEGGPFFEGYLTGFGQGLLALGHVVVLHVIHVSTWGRGSQLGGGLILVEHADRVLVPGRGLGGANEGIGVYGGVVSVGGRGEWHD